MEELFIRLIGNPITGLYAEWALYRDKKAMAASKGAVPINRLPDNMPADVGSRRIITVLAPATDVSIIGVAITGKQRRHWKKFLPYLLEEKLAEDIGALHFTASGWEPETGLLSAAVVKKTLLHFWLNELRNVGVVPHVMVPETLLMPFGSGEWGVLCDAGVVWVRAGGGEIFAVDLAALPEFFRLLTHDVKASDRLPLQCYVTSPKQEVFLQQLTLNHPGVALHFHKMDSVLSFLWPYYVCLPEKRLINLLQDEFQMERKKAEPGSFGKKAAILVAIWLISLVAIEAGQTICYVHQARTFHEDETMLYRQLFPADTKIVNPLQQMKAHMVQDKAMEREGFLMLLRHVEAAQHIGKNLNMEVDSLAFHEENHALSLYLTAGNPEILNGFAQQLNANGLRARMISLETVKEGVKGQLIVQRGDK